MVETKDLSIKELRQIQNAMLALKQGEALERASRPRTSDEAESLGNYRADTNFAGHLIELYENLIDELTYIPEYDNDKKLIPRPSEDKPLSKMVSGLYRGSGSTAGKRLEGALIAIGQLGQYNPMPEFSRPTPQSVDLNE